MQLARANLVADQGRDRQPDESWKRCPATSSATNTLGEATLNEVAAEVRRYCSPVSPY
jgi:hypothetical protein